MWSQMWLVDFVFRSFVVVDFLWVLFFKVFFFRFLFGDFLKDGSSSDETSEVLCDDFPVGSDILSEKNASKSVALYEFDREILSY